MSTTSPSRGPALERLFGTRSVPALVLAPMVRAGTLPLRLLALHHGAQTTWSEELIAKKLQSCERVANPELGTVDFVLPARSESSPVVYQTCPMEQGRNILQIGAANAEDAVKAVRPFLQDVSGIDLNCGCPQHFSLSGGMGAALLSKPCVAGDIVRALRQEVPSELTISCKIRLLDTAKETIGFIKHLEGAGVDAVTIHARRIPERPREKARWSELEDIIQGASIPVIVNGDVFRLYDTMQILKEAPSATGTMIARGAISDVASAFSPRTLSLAEVIDQYLNVALLCSPNFSNSKWFATQVVRYRTDDDHFLYPRKVMNERIARAKSFSELREAFSLDPNPPQSFDDLWNGLDRQTVSGWEEAVARACDGSSQSALKRVRQTFTVSTI